MINAFNKAIKYRYALALVVFILGLVLNLNGSSIASWNRMGEFSQNQKLKEMVANGYHLFQIQMVLFLAFQEELDLMNGWFKLPFLSLRLILVINLSMRIMVCLVRI